MNKVSFDRPSGPWYRNFSFWSDIAIRYIKACENIPKNAEHHAELKAFSELMGYRLVFESNLIEGEGLSAGETKKIVKEYFPKIPDNYIIIRNLTELKKHYIQSFLEPDKFPQLFDGVNKFKTSPIKIIPSISFTNKSRGFIEVCQHFTALLAAITIGLKYSANFYKRANDKFVKYLSEVDTYNEEDLSKMHKITLKEAREEINLFEEEKIKKLHKIIAQGLLPEGAIVKAGKYRVDDRTVGDFGVVFPSPDLVPKCMENFIKRANMLFSSHWTTGDNVFVIAAKISHEFVRIHPFPDFNGRVSRLILMIILMAYDVPFAVTLRGDKKGRNRYLSSLKKANKNHIIPYAALIAMRVAETFREIDENIILAGLPSILSFSENIS